MKISELISKLEDVQLRYGDIEVYIEHATRLIEINYVIPDLYGEGDDIIDHICYLKSQEN